MSNENGRECPAAICSGRVRGSAEAKKAGNSADGKTSGRRTGGHRHCHASGATTQRLCELDLATAGAESGRVRNRAVNQSRNGTSDAQENGMTIKHTPGSCRDRGSAILFRHATRQTALQRGLCRLAGGKLDQIAVAELQRNSLDVLPVPFAQPTHLYGSSSASVFE